MKTVRLPDDIVEALGQSGLCARWALLLSTTSDPERPRSTFRITLDSGGYVKARRLESETAARDQHALRSLMPSAFAAVLACCGPVLLEEWVDGCPLTEPVPPEPFIREAGRLMADLHAVSRVDGRFLPYDARTSDLYTYIVSRLKLIRTAGILNDATVEKLCAVMAANDPGRGRCGLTHHDFCGENMVVDHAGTLRIIDNERTRLDAFALDIARTWYRWGLRGDAWKRFHDAYVVAGGKEDAFANGPFWRIAGVTVSAWIRFRAAHPGLDIPLEELKRLSESV